MNPKPAGVDRRSFFDALGRDVAGFFQEFNRELNAPSPTEQRLAQVAAQTAALDQARQAQDAELAAVRGQLAAMQAKFQDFAAQQTADRQALGENVGQLIQITETTLARVETLKQSQKPEDLAQAEQWKATLKWARDLLLLLVGATASALYQTLIQAEVYPGLKERLLGLLRSSEPLVAPPTPPAPAPQPVPTPETPPAPQTPTPEPPRRPQTAAHDPRRIAWITIPAGAFLMGSDPLRDRDAQEREQPQHRIYLPAFQIAATPVTVVQFAAFIRATSYKTTAEQQNWDYTWFRPHGRGSQITAERGLHPVTNVTWDDAQAFCRWAQVRLPTEAEWEKAARGVDGRLFPWGDEPPDGARCNFNRPSGGDTTPVGSYPKGASPYGVLDMAGNVWEWCSSLWGLSWDKPFGYPYRADDGREDLTRSGIRILRGGSWWNDRTYVRCACRYGYDPDSGLAIPGFRVARSSP